MISCMNDDSTADVIYDSSLILFQKNEDDGFLKGDDDADEEERRLEARHRREDRVQGRAKGGVEVPARGGRHLDRARAHPNPLGRHIE